MAKLVDVIVLPRGNALKMMKAYNVGSSTLYDALRYKSFSDNAELLRQKALSDYGGFKIKKPV